MLLPAITPVLGMLICWRSVCAPLREEPKFYGYTSRINLAGADVRLLVPTTFMNLSGKAVAAMATFYRINPDEIPWPTTNWTCRRVAKFKLGGGHGGHNGLKDIISKLGNNPNFHRLRVGIGHPGDKTKLLVSYWVNPGF